MNKQQILLKNHFGYDTFRPGQDEIINQILSGRDCLAIMPTGAGKSICYQIPAMIFDRHNSSYFPTDFSYERPSK